MPKPSDGDNSADARRQRWIEDRLRESVIALLAEGWTVGEIATLVLDVIRRRGIRLEPLPKVKTL